jgi:LPS O-antigen subunit length determinant protein (WzzB/FepE family)
LPNRLVNVATAHYNGKYSVETLRGFYIIRRHKMSKLVKEFIQFFRQDKSALEQFLESKSIKTHADVEYWSKYFEYRGF